MSAMQQPSLPEHQPNPEQSVTPVLKTSAEIAALKQRHDEIKVSEERSREIVRAANTDQADLNSSEYQLVKKRIANGESAVSIRRKSAVNALGKKGEAFGVEEEYEQAKADVYEHEGIIPGMDERLIAVLGRLDNRQPVKLDAPIVQYALKRQQQGATRAQLRAEAQGRIQIDEQIRTGLRILTAGREGKLDPASADYQTYTVWVSKGWATDAVLNQVQAAAAKQDADLEKRMDYARSLLRLRRIPEEKQKTLDSQKGIQQSIDQEEIDQNRAALQNLQPQEAQALLPRQEVDKNILKQQVTETLNAPQTRGESRRYGITNGASDELYYWQADTFGNPTQTNNDLIYKGYLQVDIEDIPEAVKILREAIGERFNQERKPLEFKWLVSKFTGNKPQIGEYVPMKDPEPRIALYGDNPWDIPEVFAKITQDPRWAEKFRAISEKRNERARRPGTSSWIDSNTGYEWRALNFNERPGLSESFSADPNWRKFKRGTNTKNLAN